MERYIHYTEVYVLFHWTWFHVDRHHSLRDPSTYPSGLEERRNRDGVLINTGSLIILSNLNVLRRLRIRRLVCLVKRHNRVYQIGKRNLPSECKVKKKLQTVVFSYKERLYRNEVYIIISLKN